MLGFSRTKWVGIERPKEDVFVAHGILEDYIYGMEIDVEITAPDFIITSVSGKMRRVTTSECTRSVPLLQNAVGLRLGDPGLASTINRKVGREGCRHFANLLLECCDAVARCALFENPPGAGKGGSAREEHLKKRLEEIPFMKDTCLATES